MPTHDLLEWCPKLVGRPRVIPHATRVAHLDQGTILRKWRKPFNDFKAEDIKLPELQAKVKEKVERYPGMLLMMDIEGKIPGSHSGRLAAYLKMALNMMVHRLDPSIRLGNYWMFGDMWDRPKSMVEQSVGWNFIKTMDCIFQPLYWSHLNSFDQMLERRRGWLQALRIAKRPVYACVAYYKTSPHADAGTMLTQDQWRAIIRMAKPWCEGFLLFGSGRAKWEPEYWDIMLKETGHMPQATSPFGLPGYPFSTDASSAEVTIDAEPATTDAAPDEEDPTMEDEQGELVVGPAVRGTQSNQDAKALHLLAQWLDGYMRPRAPGDDPGPAPISAAALAAMSSRVEAAGY